VHDPVALGDAAAARAVKPDGMHLIEIGHRAEVVGDGAEFADRGDVAIHRIDRLEADELGAFGNRGLGGQTVGTIQPGIIWAGLYMQIGAEAIIPASRLTGHGYGGVVQLHFYLDDLFPNSIGRPLFRY
jgi:hypothetical protein